ncbi:acyl carrier protein [Dolosicoccus paucivorans]|uniref:acyl carrier protein n=1 Tax=Dolosicoccus paucivorans TaxID=84521 RepID=UPI000C7FBDEB|nr:acyl carrier protein [Dolosicoccus paucivorans]PMB84474.1 acyl carrier protein [Dolosicoccus paucivorans]
MNNNVFETVQQLVVDRFGVHEDKVTPEMTFQDLGADSLDVVEVIMELEDFYNVQFDDDRIESLATIGDAVNYLEELTNQ